MYLTKVFMILENFTYLGHWLHGGGGGGFRQVIGRVWHGEHSWLSCKQSARGFTSTCVEEEIFDHWSCLFPSLALQRPNSSWLFIWGFTSLRFTSTCVEEEVLDHWSCLCPSLALHRPNSSWLSIWGWTGKGQVCMKLDKSVRMTLGSWEKNIAW